MINKIIEISIASLVLAIILTIIMIFIFKIKTRIKNNESIKIHYIFLDLIESVIYGILIIFTAIKENLKSLFKRKGE